MSQPVRVQLSRQKGWRMPPNTVKVDRTTKWGNPFDFRDSSHCWTALAYGEKGNPAGRQAASVKAFREWMGTPAGMRIEDVGLYLGPVPIGTSPAVEAGTPPDPTELRGKNLACWCKPGEPCHADVLLDLANPAPRGDGQLTDSLAEPSVLSSAGGAETGPGAAMRSAKQPEAPAGGSQTVRPSVNRPFRNSLKSNE